MTENDQPRDSKSVATNFEPRAYEDTLAVVGYMLSKRGTKHRAHNIRGMKSAPVILSRSSRHKFVERADPSHDYLSSWTAN